MVSRRMLLSKKGVIFYLFLAAFLTFIYTEKDIFTQEKALAQVFFPSGTEVRAELAITPAERATGLMFREGLLPGEGMLFIFEEADFHSFWMFNMKFSIDIIWLSPEKSIVHIEHSVPPCAEEPCPTYEPMQKALYVIEVPAGFAKKESLRLGMKVLLEMEE
ncbi:MAG: DUF192 domain-containing protein [Candidatus Aminicenantes bacterium]|nr:DUF192 domain-containing protein [Candidatus Aminicenantes bacterium]